MGSIKNVSQFGPAIWPALLTFKYMNEELYYKEHKSTGKKIQN